MKILNCISCVPETTTKISFTTDKRALNAENIQYIINPNDEFGLTRSVRLKEETDAEISVLSVGETHCVPVLKKCLAIGADKAIRINKRPLDGYQVACLIADYCRQKKFDLIIVGRESIDYNGGMVGGILAVLLNYGFVSPCLSITIADQAATLIRENNTGKEQIQAMLPLVIGAQKGLTEEQDLIIPNMRSIMQARTKSFEELSGEDYSPAYEILSHDYPKTKKEVKMIHQENIDDLVEIIKNTAVNY